jgi:hypothetical protein
MKTLQQSGEEFNQAFKEFMEALGMYKLLVTMETQLQKLKQKRISGP